MEGGDSSSSDKTDTMRPIAAQSPKADGRVYHKPGPMNSPCDASDRATVLASANADTAVEERRRQQSSLDGADDRDSVRIGAENSVGEKSGCSGYYDDDDKWPPFFIADRVACPGKK